MPLDYDYVGDFHNGTRVGCDHSYTAEENKTRIAIEKYVLLSQISGHTLHDSTNADWFYCIEKDGSVFKYHPQELNFYRLDMEKFIWIYDQSYLQRIKDAGFIFQEYYNFVDYFG